MTMLGMVFWVLVGALIGATVSTYKGFGKGAGVIIGAILGPFMLLGFLASSGKKRCSGCAEWIQKKAKVCPRCQTALG